MIMKKFFKKCLALSLGVILSAATLHTTAIQAAGNSNPDVSLTTNIGGGVSQNYVIAPGGGASDVALSKVVLRYYYEKSGSKAQSFSCDSAGISLNTAPYYVDFSKNVTGTFFDNYLEIGFSKDYSLNNAKISLGVRFNNSDWSAYDNFKELKLDVLYDGKVVSTEKYSDDVTTPSQEPTVTPSQNPSTAPSVAPSTEPSVAPSVVPSTTPSQSSYILPKCDIDKDGPFAVTIDKGYGPNGKAWIARPTNPGTLGVKAHPIFIWNPGGGDQPSLYEGHLRRWASQGFVVYCEESQWSGQQCVDGLNWIIKQNDNAQSPLYKKLDVTRIAAGGFSLGSTGAYAVASDPRIKTTIHCDGGSLDGAGASKMKNPTCLMNGLADGGLASNNTQRDYEGARVPVWYGGILGGGHGSAAWDGQPAITAWLRWHLAGETELSSLFLTPNGRFNTGKFQSKWKNW